MSVRAAIYQPQYFPRLHYINRVLDSDVFVILASAQYTKSLTHQLGDGGRERRKSYQSHAPIKNHDGEHLLTVPVTSEITKASIDRTWPADGHAWRRQHRKTLTSAYGRAPRFDDRYPEIEYLLEHVDGSLAELNTTTLLWALDVLLDLDIGIRQLSLAAVNERLAQSPRTRLRRLVLDEETGVERPDGVAMGGPWTAALCVAVGADEYLYGGTAGVGYMSTEEYRDRGVALVQQEWRGRPYPQQFDDRLEFLPNLSVVDLLFNVRPADALELLWPQLGDAPAEFAVTSEHGR